MGIDVGTALIMLLRWFGSVALIIAALAVLTLFADRLRMRRQRTAAPEADDPASPTSNHGPSSVTPGDPAGPARTSGQVSPTSRVF